MEKTSYKDTIEIIKFVEEESFKAKAVICMEEDIINVLSQKFKEFLKNNSLSGGIMDRKVGEYEFELFLKEEDDTAIKEEETVKSYMVKFLDTLKEDFTLKVNEDINEDIKL